MPLRPGQRVLIVTAEGLRPGRITRKPRGRGFRVVGVDDHRYTTNPNERGERICVGDIIPYLYVGQRVSAKVKYSSTEITGRVTQNKDGIYRVVDDTGRRYTTGKSPDGRGTLIDEPDPIPPRVFVFDTMLDGDDFRGRRHAGGFWERFCNAAGWDFGTASVHSLTDLKGFLAKPLPASVLIFNGHGHDGYGSADQAGFSLSFGDKFCPSFSDGSGWVLGTDSTGTQVEADLHPDNRSKLVVFSSCLIGKNRHLCERFKEFFHARAVVAYSEITCDDICFLAEPLIVYLTESCGFSPRRSVEHAQETLRPLKSIMAKRLRSFPVVCVGGNS